MSFIVNASTAISMKLLLIITGSIAAYKSLELIRRAREAGHEVTGILTAGGAQFITPMAVSALTERKTYTDLWSLKDEVEMGHIRLAREHDAILIAPASADFIAKVAQGRADDLASTCVLASEIPLYTAPAMNQAMWQHPVTQTNIKTVMNRGAKIITGAPGDMACGETGPGRMAEPLEILSHIENERSANNLPLAGKTALVTAGPTVEAIDPVRYLSNHSSGKQGYAIAAALAQAGAEVTLFSGPTALDCPPGVTRVDVISAEEMLEISLHALPVDIAVACAAVADWKIDRVSAQKLKKSELGDMPTLRLIENPDILAAICEHEQRPPLVVGFAAETEELEEHALAKLQRKGCDWILANDATTAFGAENNQILFCTRSGNEAWPAQSKQDVATQLIERMTSFFTSD